MSVAFSPSEKGFFLVYSSLDSLPDDIVFVSDEVYDEIQEQLQFDGVYDRSIGVTENGYPTVVYERIDTAISPEMIRSQRNHLLRESDWSQLEDIPCDIKKPYKKYRQELRDVTSQEGFPENVTWPIPPKGD